MSSRPSLILRKIIVVVSLPRTTALLCVPVSLRLAVSSDVLSLANTFVSGALAVMLPGSVLNGTVKRKGYNIPRETASVVLLLLWMVALCVVLTMLACVMVCVGTSASISVGIAWVGTRPGIAIGIVLRWILVKGKLDRR